MTTPITVRFSMRKLRQTHLDEMRIMRVRQRRTMESIVNEAIAIGLRVMKKREVRAREERRRAKSA